MCAAAECNSVFTYMSRYIYHPNYDSAEAETCWETDYVNNNMYNRTGNVQT